MTEAKTIRPKLVMAITELDAGGAERAFVRIACGLSQRGWPVSVISLRNAGPLASELEANSIPVTALHCGGFMDVRALPRMTACLQSGCPDVLLTFLHQANIVGRLAAWRARVPVVVSSVRVADRRWSVAASERLTRSLVTAWTVVSDSVGDTHARLCRIEQRQMLTICNGVDVEAMDAAAPVPRESLGMSSDHFVILAAGRLTAQKAPGDLLRALAVWRDSDPGQFERIRLLYAGDGPLRTELEQNVQHWGLTDHVRFAGVRSDLPGLMKSASVLVLASRWEGLPNVLLEAMAARLPVMASAVDGNSELVREGVTGRLFPAGDARALAALLSETARTPETSRRLADAARELVEQRYRWDTCVDQYDELLCRLSAAAGKPQS